MENNNRDYKKIPGWGMDADPKNEPTYPMKNYTGADHDRIRYERPVQQGQEVEILKSTERPALTAVFGTSVPPSGLSGMVRRYAFRHSEDRYRHWLPLILADRINMVEGLFEDFAQGHVPNIIKERGWVMEWRYRRGRFIKKLAVSSIVVAGALALFFRKGK